MRPYGLGILIYDDRRRGSVIVHHIRCHTRDEGMVLHRFVLLLLLLLLYLSLYLSLYEYIQSSLYSYTYIHTPIVLMLCVYHYNTRARANCFRSNQVHTVWPCIMA